MGERLRAAVSGVQRLVTCHGDLLSISRESADDHRRCPYYSSDMTIRDLIERHGHIAHGGDPDAATEAWEETGLDAAEVEEWLKARCFNPSAAEDMADAGITPEMAMMKTDAGSGDYVDTVAFKVATGDLEVEEARDLVGAS
jgi:hypothetical protein